MESDGAVRTGSMSSIYHYKTIKQWIASRVSLRIACKSSWAVLMDTEYRTVSIILLNSIDRKGPHYFNTMRSIQTFIGHRLLTNAYSTEL